MTFKVWIVALVALCVGVSAANADPKKHRRHVRKPAPAPVEVVPPFWGLFKRDSAPAHFVRLPNGLIVSSYQCFVDEGYGRYTPCDAGLR